MGKGVSEGWEVPETTCKHSLVLIKVLPVSVDWAGPLP